MGPGQIKTISLLLLSIPLLLLLIYTPPSTFSLTPLTDTLTKHPTAQSLSTKALSSIEQTIQLNKLTVSSEQKHRLCSLYTKVGDEDEVGLEGKECGFCGQGVWGGVDVGYFHLLVLGDGEGVGSSVGEFQMQLRQGLDMDIRIVWEVLDSSILPLQIKDKITDLTYTKNIAHQLSQLPQNKHCRYTAHPCKGYTLLLGNWSTLDESYLEVGSIVFANLKDYRETVIGLLGGQCLTAHELRRVKRIQGLIGVREELKRVEGMMGNHMVEPRVDKLAIYIDQLQAYINGSIKSLPPPFLATKQNLSIDLFPSEYKLGIYLPILLIMVIFPCSNVLKL